MTDIIYKNKERLKKFRYTKQPDYRSIRHLMTETDKMQEISMECASVYKTLYYHLRSYIGKEVKIEETGEIGTINSYTLGAEGYSLFILKENGIFEFRNVLEVTLDY